MKTRIQLVAAIAATLLLLLPEPGSAQGSAADGIRLWSQNCGRCHNFRPAEERTDAEWVVIVAHMRARANLTKSTARAILGFLQTSNGQGGTVAKGPGATTAESPTPAETAPEALTETEWALLLEILGVQADAPRRVPRAQDAPGPPR